MRVLSFLTGLLLVSSLVVACFLTNVTKEETAELYSNGPTLMVINEGGQPIKVYLESSFGGSRQTLIGFLARGSKCVALPRSSISYNLVVVNMDGRWVSPPFVPLDRPAWKWVIGSSPDFDVLSLGPANDKCQPR